MIIAHDHYQDSIVYRDKTTFVIKFYRDIGISLSHMPSYVFANISIYVFA